MVPKPVPAVVAQLQWKGVVQVLVLIRLTGCLGTSLGTPTPRTRMGFVLRAASEMSPSDFAFSDLAYQASKKQKIKKTQIGMVTSSSFDPSLWNPGQQLAATRGIRIWCEARALSLVAVKV